MTTEWFMLAATMGKKVLSQNIEKNISYFLSTVSVWNVDNYSLCSENSQKFNLPIFLTDIGNGHISTIISISSFNNTLDPYNSSNEVIFIDYFSCPICRQCFFFLALYNG